MEWRQGVIRMSRASHNPGNGSRSKPEVRPLHREKLAIFVWVDPAVAKIRPDLAPEVTVGKEPSASADPPGDRRAMPVAAKLATRDPALQASQQELEERRAAASHADDEQDPGRPDVPPLFPRGGIDDRACAQMLRHVNDRILSPRSWIGEYRGAGNVGLMATVEDEADSIRKKMAEARVTSRSRLRPELRGPGLAPPQKAPVPRRSAGIVSNRMRRSRVRVMCSM